MRRAAGGAAVETGAIDFPQRFGGSLNLHVHLHVHCHAVFVDGVFSKDASGAARFVETPPPPARADLERIVGRVRDRSPG